MTKLHNFMTATIVTTSAALFKQKKKEYENSGTGKLNKDHQPYKMELQNLSRQALMKIHKPDNQQLKDSVTVGSKMKLSNFVRRRLS